MKTSNRRPRGEQMKVGIVGAGFVGSACASSMVQRCSCHEIVLIDINKQLESGRRADLSDLTGSTLRPTKITGGYTRLQGAEIVVVTAGINEKAGGATDRGDKLGRLRLLPYNAEVYANVIPQIAKITPRATILVVTDPPDALADVARRYTRTNPIISAGTFLDTLRFRRQIAQRLHCSEKSVDAIVIGEHGNSKVYVWSSARIGTRSVIDLARELGWNPKKFRNEVEDAVRHANIDIIEGTGASQLGIGGVTAMIVEAILRNAGLVEPVGIWNPDLGVTLSLPTVIGKGSKLKVIDPPLTAEERRLLRASAKEIRKALFELEKLKPRPTSKRVPQYSQQRA
jgi:L-lactate dehydrogenase